MDNFSEQIVQNDRLAFDYVFCPPETKRFKFKLLQVCTLYMKSHNDYLNLFEWKRTGHKNNFLIKDYLLRRNFLI